MAFALPNTFVLRSTYNNKYLAYIKDEGEVHGLLQFSAEDVNELTVFQVEPAKTAGGALVHVKCCYNNKYWRRWSPTDNWIAAEADEPEEDMSKWSCTLFQPLYCDAGGKTITLTHMQLGHFACASTAKHPYAYCLFAAAASHDQDKLDTFNITELSPVSREITDVEFRLNEAKLSGQTTVILGRGVAVNGGSDTNEVQRVTVEYDKEETKTWKCTSCWLNSELITDIMSAIPAVVNGKAVLSGDVLTGAYQMGKTMVSKDSVKTSYDVVVPARSLMVVSLKATKAEFEVPFTFTHRDTFSDNKELTFNRSHGTFTGVALFDLVYETVNKHRSDGSYF